MKAVVVNEFGGGFHTEDVAIDDPIGAEVLFEVKAAGLCRSDLTAANFDLGYPVPAVFGHEVAGVVTAVGPEVTDIQVGDHVVGSIIQHCGHCASCLTGKSFRCSRPEATLRSPDDAPRLSRPGAALTQGYGLGGFAQQALVHANQLVVVPEELPMAQAALLGCGVITGAGAVLNTARVRPGENVVILGAGGAGLNAVSGAVLAGAAPIIVVDVSAEKLEKAQTFGATHLIDSAANDPLEAVREITGGGADHVFDFVGLGSLQEQALEMLCTGGGVYIIGVTPGSTFTVDGYQMLQGQKTIQGVYMGSSILRRDVPLYVQAYLAGRFQLDALVSREISLDQVAEGYEALKDPSITRVVITDLS